MRARLYGVFVRGGPGARWGLVWIGPRPAIYHTEAATTDARRGMTMIVIRDMSWKNQAGEEYEVAPVLVDARLRQSEVEAIRKRRGK